ncbi:hypothetical protein HDU92_007053 [Lobulomyces angularis]|nr:hypothetical protein HDU92_007053 [Lobulomyces angularis]
MEKLKQENVLKDEDLLKEKLNSTLYPKIAQMVGTEIKFSSDRILFNEKILCLFCSNLEGVESFNKYPHVTLGTISESVKPVESNLLLEKYFTNTIGKDECKSIVLDEPLQFQGCINGFYY